MPIFQLGDRAIGDGEPVFIIAEAGVNHNGDLDKAHRLIDAAADAGADAVKFQTFITKENISQDAPLAGHHLANVGEELSHFDLIMRLELPFNDFRKLKTHTEDRGMVFLSTPYDLPSAEFLIKLKCDAIKVASSEMTNLPLLDVIGRSSTPVILSTGMSTWDEILESVDFFAGLGAQTCILKCTSNYPASPEGTNLLGIAKLRQAFPDCVIGFSDHSEGNEISLASLGLGASIIERHFTLDKDDWGPDHRASCDPPELTVLVSAVRRVEQALGVKEWDVQPEERAQRATMQKGVYANRDIGRGEKVTMADVSLLRPPAAITPKVFFREYAGRSAECDIASGSALSPEMF